MCVARARPLDLLALGEREARHLGVDTERERTLVIAAGGARDKRCCCGRRRSSRFVGLVVPHLFACRRSAHRVLLPASFALGGALLVLADLIARTAAAPVELPLGVVTALLGGPFFLWLIWRTRRAHGGWG